MTTYISRSLVEHARDFDVSISKAPTDFYRYSGDATTQCLFKFQKPGGGYVLMKSHVPCTYFKYSGIIPYLDVMDGCDNLPSTEYLYLTCEHTAFCCDTDKFGLSVNELKNRASRKSVPAYDEIQSVSCAYHNIPLVGFMHSILSSLSKSPDKNIVWLSEHGVRYYDTYYGLEVSYVQGDVEVYTPFPKVSVSSVCRDYGFYAYMEDNWLFVCDKAETSLGIYTDRRGILTDRLGSPRKDFFGSNLSLICSFSIHVQKTSNYNPDGSFVPFPKSMKILHELVDGKLQLCYYDDNGNVIETVMCDAPFADHLWFDIVPMGSYHSSVIDYFRNGFDGMLYVYQDVSGTRYLCVSMCATDTRDASNGFKRMALDNGQPVYVRFFSRIN